jgi:hypothetical protein
MPAHQGFKGGFVPLGEEALQQLAVCHPAAIAKKGGPANLPEQIGFMTLRHVTCSLVGQLLSPFVYWEHQGLCAGFLWKLLSVRHEAHHSAHFT